MKVAFVQFLYFEYIGLMYLSACLKRGGNEVEVFIPTSTTKKLVEEILDFEPDIVGFSVMTGTQDWALSVLSMVKDKMAVYSILGGPHPTFFPEMINEEGVDCICIGEAEETLVDIVSRISNGEVPSHIPGAWCKADGEVIRNEPRKLIQNLEELPYPDRTLYRHKYPLLPKSKATFFAGRGCPFDCTFCFNHSLMEIYRNKGRYVRLRPVDDLINEIKEVIKTQRIQTVYFQDDTFIISKKWIEEFAAIYKKEIGLPFICLIRADLADEDVIRNLANANCKTVFLGIESGVETIRNLILKKKLTDRQIVDCAELLKKYRIKFRAYNMIGLPGETIDDAFKTVQLNSSIQTDYPWCSIFYPFPRTELAEYAQKIGIAEKEDMFENTSFFKSSALKIENRDEFANLQKLFLYAVKLPKLQPLFRRMIKMKPNLFFEMLFLFGYGWSYLFAERVSLMELFLIGKLNIRRILGKVNYRESR